MAESGIDGLEVSGFTGLMGPPKMPEHLVKRLHAEAVKMAKDRDFAARHAVYDMQPVASTPQEFVRYMQREIERWGVVIRSAGIKTQ